jgi:uncharacterized protein (DUF488 family)
VLGRAITIGVYGWDAASFLAALRAGRVDVVLDLRRRRGVRGQEYVWANSRRLQGLLAGAGIGYEHLLELAPTNEMRKALYAAAAARGESQRERTGLTEVYRSEYVREILGRADLERLLAGYDRSSTGALMCVERSPRACHRSLVASALHDRHGVAVEDVLPVERS